MIDEQAKRRSSFWRELPILVAVAVVVAIVVRAFVLQTFFIPSESMENTLDINDRVLVNKLLYDFRDPHRGEIVVFNSPTSWRSEPGDKDFIKRVIGVGGDHIVCCDAQHRITVNGKALNESSYLYPEPGQAQPASPDPFDVVVPAGRLWMMGDHRYRSGDSRENYLRTHDINQATIPVDSVVGRAFALFWPFSRAEWLSVPGTYDNVPVGSS